MELSFFWFIYIRGLISVYTPALWKLSIPPRVQIFLWLLSHNKLLTRNNLCRRQNVNDRTCETCSELEDIYHLFFECNIAKVCWKEISDLLNLNLGHDYEFIAKWWISDSKHE